jgi:hypothetical protein
LPAGSRGGPGATSRSAANPLANFRALGADFRAFPAGELMVGRVDQHEVRRSCTSPRTPSSGESERARYACRLSPDSGSLPLRDRSCRGTDRSGCSGSFPRSSRHLCGALLARASGLLCRL